MSAVAPPSRGRTVAYWGLTLFVVVTQGVAGVMDVMHAAPLFPLLLHLGYPPHFATVLGTWKELGAIALAAPGYPRVKEWAYAGMFIDYSSAVFAHLSAGDSPGVVVTPLLSIAALVASYLLRPASRRL